VPITPDPALLRDYKELIKQLGQTAIPEISWILSVGYMTTAGDTIHDTRRRRTLPLPKRYCDTFSLARNHPINGALTTMPFQASS
jgi:hypothetical protein